MWFYYCVPPEGVTRAGGIGGGPFWGDLLYLRRRRDFLGLYFKITSSSVKIIYLTFLTNPLGPKVYYRVAHEGDLFLTMPLIILSIFSVFFGFITKDIFVGLGTSFFIDNSVFIHPSHEILIDTEFGVPVMFKLLPFCLTVILSVLAIILAEFLPELIINFKLSRLGYNIFGLLNQRFHLDMFYNKYVVNLVLNLGGITTKVLDKGSIELLGPFGLEVGLISLSKSISSFSTGIVTTYALYILISSIFYLLLVYLVNLNFDFVLLIILIIFSLTTLDLKTKDI